MRLSYRNSPYLMRDRPGSSAVLNVRSKPRSAPARDRDEVGEQRCPAVPMASAPATPPAPQAPPPGPGPTRQAAEEEGVRVAQVAVLQQHQGAGPPARARARQAQPGRRHQQQPPQREGARHCLHLSVRHPASPGSDPLQPANQRPFPAGGAGTTASPPTRPGSD